MSGKNTDELRKPIDSHFITVGLEMNEDLVATGSVLIRVYQDQIAANIG